MTNNITEDKANLSLSQQTLYDRQIRLWGLEAQKMLMNGSVLVIGLSTLSSEVLKNLVLAGIQQLSIMDIPQKDHKSDYSLITEDDFTHGTNFLYTRQAINKRKIDIYKEKINSFNEHANVEIIEEYNTSKELLRRFQLVCYFGDKITDAKGINSICHENNIAFIYAGCYGFYGFLFADFGDYTYRKKTARRRGDICTTIGDIKNNKEVETQNFKKEEITTIVDCEDNVLENGLNSKNEIIITENIKYNELEHVLNSNINLNTKKPMRIKRFANIMFMICILLLSGEQNIDKQNNKERIAEIWDTLYARIAENTRRTNVKFYSEKSLQFLNSEVLTKINEYLSFVTGDVCACSSIIGGIVSQEITKFLTNFDEPINNFLCYDGIDADAIAHTIANYPKAILDLDTQENSSANKY